MKSHSLFSVSEHEIEKLLYSFFNAFCSQKKWVCVLHNSVKDFRQRRETAARRNASSYGNGRKFLLL